MKVYASDFETTVYEGQTSTEVWSSALALINTKDEAIVLQSITETLAFLRDLYDDIILYYHNLKFDGSFWIDYLMRKTNRATRGCVPTRCSILMIFIRLPWCGRIFLLLQFPLGIKSHILVGIHRFCCVNISTHSIGTGVPAYQYITKSLE